jgi:hypothetical protein
VPTEAALQDQDGTDCSEVGGSECLGPLVTPPVGRDDHGGTEKGGSEGETKGQTKVKFCRNKGPRTHTHTHTLGCPGQVGMNVRTKTKAKILATNTLHTPRGLFPLPLSSCNLLCTCLVVCLRQKACAVTTSLKVPKTRRYMHTYFSPAVLKDSLTVVAFYRVAAPHVRGLRLAPTQFLLLSEASFPGPFLPRLPASTALAAG